MTTRAQETTDVDALRGRLVALEQELGLLRNALRGAWSSRAPLPAEAFRVLRLEIGGQPYAMALACVTEVVRVARLVRQGREIGAVLGTLNYRGEAVPVLDLGLQVLGVPTRWRLTTPIVITQIEDKHVGFVVDEVSGVDDVPSAEARHATVPEHGDATVWFVVELESRLVQILDPEAIHAVARLGETVDRKALTDAEETDESAK